MFGRPKGKIRIHVRVGEEAGASDASGAAAAAANNVLRVKVMVSDQATVLDLKLAIFELQSVQRHLRSRQTRSRGYEYSHLRQHLLDTPLLLESGISLYAGHTLASYGIQHKSQVTVRTALAIDARYGEVVPPICDPVCSLNCKRCWAAFAKSQSPQLDSLLPVYCGKGNNSSNDNKDAQICEKWIEKELAQAPPRTIVRLAKQNEAVLSLPEYTRAGAPGGGEFSHVWTGIIVPPENGIYADTLIPLRVYFPPAFPFAAPHICVHVFHPAVSLFGGALPLLDEVHGRDWVPSASVWTTIVAFRDRALRDPLDGTFPLANPVAERMLRGKLWDDSASLIAKAEAAWLSHPWIGGVLWRDRWSERMVAAAATEQTLEGGGEGGDIAAKEREHKAEAAALAAAHSLLASVASDDGPDSEAKVAMLSEQGNAMALTVPANGDQNQLYNVSTTQSINDLRAFLASPSGGGGGNKIDVTAARGSTRKDHDDAKRAALDGSGKASDRVAPPSPPLPAEGSQPPHVPLVHQHDGAWVRSPQMQHGRAMSDAGDHSLGVGGEQAHGSMVTVLPIEVKSREEFGYVNSHLQQLETAFPLVHCKLVSQAYAGAGMDANACAYFLLQYPPPSSEDMIGSVPDPPLQLLPEPVSWIVELEGKVGTGAGGGSSSGAGSSVSRKPSLFQRLSTVGRGGSSEVVRDDFVGAGGILRAVEGGSSNAKGGSGAVLVVSGAGAATVGPSPSSRAGGADVVLPPSSGTKSSKGKKRQQQHEGRTRDVAAAAAMSHMDASEQRAIADMRRFAASKAKREARKRRLLQARARHGTWFSGIRGPKPVEIDGSAAGMASASSLLSSRATGGAASDDVEPGAEGAQPFHGVSAIVTSGFEHKAKSDQGSAMEKMKQFHQKAGIIRTGCDHSVLKILRNLSTSNCDEEGLESISKQLVRAGNELKTWETSVQGLDAEYAGLVSAAERDSSSELTVAEEERKRGAKALLDARQENLRLKDEGKMLIEQANVKQQEHEEATLKTYARREQLINEKRSTEQKLEVLLKQVREYEATLAKLDTELGDIEMRATTLLVRQSRRGGAIQQRIKLNKRERSKYNHREMELRKASTRSRDYVRDLRRQRVRDTHLRERVETMRRTLKESAELCGRVAGVQRLIKRYKLTQDAAEPLWLIVTKLAASQEILYGLDWDFIELDAERAVLKSDLGAKAGENDSDGTISGGGVGNLAANDEVKVDGEGVAEVSKNSSQCLSGFSTARNSRAGSQESAGLEGPPSGHHGDGIGLKLMLVTEKIEQNREAHAQEHHNLKLLNNQLLARVREVDAMSRKRLLQDAIRKIDQEMRSTAPSVEPSPTGTISAATISTAAGDNTSLPDISKTLGGVDDAPQPPAQGE